MRSFSSPQWAYCYIGLYGYDYLTAGRNVLQLFHDRGWTTLITDELVSRTLSLMSLVVGLATGAVGILIAQVFPQWVDPFSSSAAVSFCLPALVGTAMAYILFQSVVGAAVDTVIVVFAQSPLEFERNHPGLYRQMGTAWRRVYPDEFRL
jgi:drug/metabolite transporter (DMT)-like permease